MINFKNFIVEVVLPVPMREVHQYHGNHEEVAKAATMLHGLHDLVLKKKSPITATAIHPGEDIQAGYHKGKMTIRHGGKSYTTFDDISKGNQSNPELAHMLLHLARVSPDIFPQKQKMYSGKINKADDHKLNLIIHGNENGNPLSPQARVELGSHPEVNHIDPTFRGGHISPDKHHEFLESMNSARKAYSSMSPDGLEDIGGHSRKIEAYVKRAFETGEEPSDKGFKEYLHNNRHIDRFTRSLNPITSRNILNTHASDMEQINSSKDYGKFIMMLNGMLKGSRAISSALPSNMIIHHGDDKALIKKYY